MNEDNTVGWVKLYHPSGALVTFPLDLNIQLTQDQAVTVFSSVSNLLEQKFTVYQPGLDDGEKLVEIGYIVRKSKSHAEEGETPVMDLYPVTGNFRHLAKYLNTPEDVAVFEALIGRKIETLPLWEGDNAIERGKSPKTDRYVTKLDKPIKVVWKINPRYDPEETDIKKKKPRRLFVRYAEPPTMSHPATPATPPAKAMSWDDALATLTPNGMRIGDLSDAQLKQLAGSRASNVTEDMKTAANIILEATANGENK